MLNDMTDVCRALLRFYLETWNYDLPRGGRMYCSAQGAIVVEISAPF